MRSSMPGPFRYAAFLSYRKGGEDEKWAKLLQESLESYVLPSSVSRELGIPRRLGRLFRDDAELRPTEDLNAAIIEAIASSRFMIVLCSPRARESQWIDAEIRAFHERRGSSGLLLVLLDGEPHSAFPLAVFGPGDRKTAPEPLAVDVRRSTGESTGSLLRLATVRLGAAIIGCDFDTLWQRDSRRRARRLLIGWGLVTAAFAGTMLGLFKMSQLSEAAANTEATLWIDKAGRILQSGDADSRAQAALLLHRALDRLDAIALPASLETTGLKYQALGNLIPIESDERVITDWEYFAALSKRLPVAEGDSQDRRLRLSVHLRRGNILRSQGRPGDALLAFEAAMALCSPDDPEEDSTLEAIANLREAVQGASPAKEVWERLLTIRGAKSDLAAPGSPSFDRWADAADELGCVLLAKNDDEAVDHYRAAVSRAAALLSSRELDASSLVRLSCLAAGFLRASFSASLRESHLVTMQNLLSGLKELGSLCSGVDEIRTLPEIPETVDSATLEAASRLVCHAVEICRATFAIKIDKPGTVLHAFTLVLRLVGRVPEAPACHEGVEATLEFLETNVDSDFEESYYAQKETLPEAILDTIRRCASGRQAADAMGRLATFWIRNGFCRSDVAAVERGVRLAAADVNVVLSAPGQIAIVEGCLEIAYAKLAEEDRSAAGDFCSGAERALASLPTDVVGSVEAARARIMCKCLRVQLLDDSSKESISSWLSTSDVPSISEVSNGKIDESLRFADRIEAAAWRLHELDSDDLAYAVGTLGPSVRKGLSREDPVDSQLEATGQAIVDIATFAPPEVRISLLRDGLSYCREAVKDQPTAASNALVEALTKLAIALLADSPGKSEDRTLQIGEAKALAEEAVQTWCTLIETKGAFKGLSFVEAWSDNERLWKPLGPAVSRPLVERMLRELDSHCEPSKANGDKPNARRSMSDRNINEFKMLRRETLRKLAVICAADAEVSCKYLTKLLYHEKQELGDEPASIVELFETTVDLILAMKRGAGAGWKTLLNVLVQEVRQRAQSMAGYSQENDRVARLMGNIVDLVAESGGPSQAVALVKDLKFARIRLQRAYGTSKFINIEEVESLLTDGKLFEALDYVETHRFDGVSEEQIDRTEKEVVCYVLSSDLKDVPPLALICTGQALVAEGQQLRAAEYFLRAMPSWPDSKDLYDAAEAFGVAIAVDPLRQQEWHKACLAAIARWLVHQRETLSWLEAESATGTYPLEELDSAQQILRNQIEYVRSTDPALAAIRGSEEFEGLFQ